MQLLLLTGQREAVITLEANEIHENSLVISRERNKSGERINVPLSALAKRLIDELGNHEGPYVVSTTDGAKPVSGFSKLKQKLDELTGIRNIGPFTIFEAESQLTSKRMV